MRAGESLVVRWREEGIGRRVELVGVNGTIKEVAMRMRLTFTLAQSCGLGTDLRGLKRALLHLHHAFTLLPYPAHPLDPSLRSLQSPMASWWVSQCRRTLVDQDGFAADLPSPS